MLDLSATELKITMKMADKSLLQYKMDNGAANTNDKANVVC